MRLFFLIPLFTGLIAGYFLNKKSDEIAYIAGVLTAISLILCLILAPWQVQLGLLVVVLFGSKKLLQKMY
jgi:drug/metabolite transporter (DMT)-like permease